MTYLIQAAKNNLTNDPKQPPISVIITVHNGGDKFQQCLNSILASDVHPEEIIVVINGGVESLPKTTQPCLIKTIYLPVHCGAAIARNVGAQNAAGDILLFVNGDVVLNAHTIGKFQEIFANNSNISAVVAGSITENDDASTSFFGKLKNIFKNMFKDLFDCHTHQITEENGVVFWSTCGAVNRDVFFAVGCFGDAWSQVSVDIEFGYRLVRSGYQIKLCLNAQVTQLQEADSLSRFKAAKLRKLVKTATNRDFLKISSLTTLQKII